MVKDVLNLFDGLLLLDVSLSETFKDTLLVALEAPCLVIFFTNLYDL